MDPDLEESLDGVLETLRASSRGGRISASKIMAVAKVCVGEGKHDYKHVVHKIERFTRKLKGDQALVGLYTIDSICKRSQKVFGGSAKDVYSKRFAKNIESVLAAIASRISPKDCVTACLVVEAWRELGLMEGAILDRCAAVARGSDISASSAGGASGPPSAATASSQTAPAALAASTTAVHVAAEAVAALFSGSGGAAAAQRPQQHHAYASMNRAGQQQLPPPLQHHPRQHPQRPPHAGQHHPRQRLRPHPHPQHPERERRRAPLPLRAPLEPPPPPRRVGHSAQSAQSPPYSYAMSPQSWAVASPPAGGAGGVVPGSPASYYAAAAPRAQMRAAPREYRAASGPRPRAPLPPRAAARHGARKDIDSHAEHARGGGNGKADARGGGELKRGRASRWGDTAPRAPPHGSPKRSRIESYAPPRREGAQARRG